MRELSGSHVQISALRFCQTAAPSGNCLPWQLSPFTHRWHKMCTLFFIVCSENYTKKTNHVLGGVIMWFLLI